VATRGGRAAGPRASTSERFLTLGA
jgi:hypothetical protein